MADQDVFGGWLKRQRKSLDLSREALARQAHCSVSTVRRLEAGDLRPSPSLAASLAVALNIPQSEQEAFIRFARGDATAYPPTASTPAAPLTPVHLPAPLTSLIGRQEEVTAVGYLLSESGVRLLTLSGPPGVGKTRLSIAAANRLAESDLFPDGIYFVPLAPVSEPPLVVSAVAQVLGVRETPGSGQPLYATLKSFLNTKRLLLVLDNFEQVTAAAPFVTDWLAAAAGVKVLVTSRELLHVYGEYDFPVPPLPMPDINRLPTTSTSSFYGRYPAIQLFKDRARAARLDFQLTPENAADIAHICAWLDGLPLAIEMAAAQVKWLPPHQILTQLSHRLTALTGGPRDLSPRQQSLHGAIEWSYTLLGKNQQWLFDVLGVFAGGCDLEAVTAIISQLTPADDNFQDNQTLRSHLQLLVEKSLLGYEVTFAGDVRYEMLATLREYAWQRLQTNEQIDAARQAHAHTYFQLAETASTQLGQGVDPAAWFKRLEQEYNNIRTALTWATETSDHAIFAQKLARAMFSFWDTHGYLQEGRQWMERALELDHTPSEVRGHLLNYVGWLARMQGDYEAAGAYQERALAIQQVIGDKVGISRSLEYLAVLAGSQGNIVEANELLEQALVINRELGDMARILITLNNLAIVAWQRQDFDRADALYRENETLSRANQNPRVLARALHGRGTVQLSLGNYAAALSFFQESLLIRQELGERTGMINSLGGAADAIFHLVDASVAIRLTAAALKQQAAMGKVSSPVMQDDMEEKLTLIRTQLGDAAFTQAWAEGEALSLEEAVSLVISIEVG